MAIKTNTTIRSKSGKEYKYARITRTIGHNLDGTPIKKQFTGRTKTDAEQKADEYISNINDGLPINFQSITLDQMLNDWLYNVKRSSKDLRASSFDRYDCTYRNHIKNSTLASLALYTISSLPIQRFYNEKYKNGTSENQIKEINKLLKCFFNWCVEHDYIRKNPCSSKMIELPGKSEELSEEDDENDIQIFTDDEIKEITSAIKEKGSTYDVNIIALLGLATGLRQGELLGLAKQYLDLNNCIVKVRKTLKKVKIYDSETRYHWETKLQKPKTKTSIRNVDIPQSVIPILRIYLKKVEKKYQDNGLEFSNNSLIFTTDTCQPIDSGNLARAWERFLKRANVAYRKFHSLRHTYASILFKKGANILEVKELLGHSDSKITEKIYIHVCPDSKKETVNKISSFFTEL